ncbi:hypothetical protein [Rhodococcus sp. NPDC058521]|uniref:hypothetical protein n=1 Tax=Rhodococcus sp. NPDC058521 TaxID=3346536 RepID=UPI003659EEDD
MDDALDPYEVALRQLPTSYSLALRLRDARVSDQVICEYLAIEREALPTVLRIAEEKLAAAFARGLDPG